jgi:dipeptidyl-peptidase 4
MRKNIQILAFFILIAAFLTSPQYLSAQTSHEMAEAYIRAESMLGNNLRNKVFRMSVQSTQIDNNLFWYAVNTRRGEEFYLVNVNDLTKEHAFDHERLAQSIRQATSAYASAWNLGIRNLEFADGLQTIRFEKNRSYVTCSVLNYECNVTGDVHQRVNNSVLSPDGKLAAFRKDHNLWVQILETGEEIQLTANGEEKYGFGTDNHGWRRSETPIMKWSPDSKKIATFRQDDRDVGLMTLWRTEVGRPTADVWPLCIARRFNRTNAGEANH